MLEGGHGCMDKTFIGTPGSSVFKLGISGLTFSGSGNFFFRISECRDFSYLNSGPQDFVFLSPGFRDQDPSYPPQLIDN